MDHLKPDTSSRRLHKGKGVFMDLKSTQGVRQVPKGVLRAVWRAVVLLCCAGVVMGCGDEEKTVCVIV